VEEVEVEVTAEVAAAVAVTVVKEAVEEAMEAVVREDMVVREEEADTEDRAKEDMEDRVKEEAMVEAVRPVTEVAVEVTEEGAAAMTSIKLLAVLITQLLWQDRTHLPTYSTVHQHVSLLTRCTSTGV